MSTPASELTELSLDRVPRSGPRSAGETALKAILVATLHLVLVRALATITLKRQIETILNRLEVKVIEERPPPPPEVEKPKPRPMSPRPVVRERREIPPPPQPQPPVLESVAPTSPVQIAPAPPPAPAREAEAPAAVPRTAPRFDADYLKNPPPAYPAISRRYGEQGQVLLKVFVGTDGTAKKVLLERSSGFPRLDEAAHDAVHQWRFVPARRGTEPIEDWVLVPIVFRLSN